MSDNLKLWNSVCETDPKHTKNFKGKGGFQGTAVDAQYQRKEATTVFGPYGLKWGIKDEVYEVLYFDPSDPHTARLIYKAILYYEWENIEGSFPVASEIDMWMYSKSYKSWSGVNDIHKKVRTDAMTKGLSELGFNADIFEGKYDDSKYVQEMRKKHEDEGKPDVVIDGPVPKTKSVKDEVKPVDDGDKNSGRDSKKAESKNKPTPTKTKKDGGQNKPAPSPNDSTGSIPETNGNDFDSLYKHVVSAANGAPENGMNPKHVVTWMREANDYKKADDIDGMKELIGKLNNYLPTDEGEQEDIIAGLSVPQLEIF